MCGDMLTEPKVEFPFSRTLIGLTERMDTCYYPPVWGFPAQTALARDKKRNAQYRNYVFVITLGSFINCQRGKGVGPRHSRFEPEIPTPAV